jgi:hypothetical protein
MRHPTIPRKNFLNGLENAFGKLYGKGGETVLWVDIGEIQGYFYRVWSGEFWGF